MKKIKVRLFDKKLANQFLEILSIVSLLSSFILIFIDIPDEFKGKLGRIFIIVLVIIYIILWVKANCMEKVTLKINNSIMEIKIGDIFKESEFKVIAFNEYFDTKVDDRLISENTLNGIYINNYVKDVKKLNSLIDADIDLSRKIIDQNNDKRIGKNKRYKLGSIYKHGDYLLTAFSKFDDDNRAYLSMKDYISFLLNFWNEIDIIYNGKSVAIPLLGSGLTRFKKHDVLTEQELLELLIWSFKVSKIKFAYSSKVSIVIHESKKDKINFYKLRSDNYVI